VSVPPATTDPVVFITTDASDIHADHVVNALASRGVRVLRFHPEDYPREWQISLWPTATGPGFSIKGRYHSARSGDVIAAWYRRPGPVGVPPSAPDIQEYVRRQSTAAVRAMYRALEGRWLVSPDALTIAEDKVVQLQRASRLGLATPRTCVSNDPAEVRAFFADVGGSIAVKPDHVQGIFHEGVFRFPLTARWDGQAEDAAIAASPTIYQEYVEKKLEIRAVVIGARVFAAEVPAVDADLIDVRGREELLSVYRPHDLPEPVARKLVQLTSGFGSRFCSADLLVTPDDEYVFLELNPNGQWLWLDLVAGLKLTDALVDELLATPACTVRS
jgi:glutathione synthase/RimK-type ligase-like ATP-grasp enzyme